MGNDIYGNQNPGTASSGYNELVFVFQQLLAQCSTIKIVKVLSCTNSGGVSPWGSVSVQPCINQMTGNRQPVAHGEIFNVPYFRIQGGRQAIIIDPQAGDFGVCAFSDRDISLFKAAPGIVNPGSNAMMDWADGLYLGGFCNGAPTSYVQFEGTTINIIAAGQVNINSNGAHTTIDGVDFLDHKHSYGTLQAPNGQLVGGLTDVVNR